MTIISQNASVSQTIAQIRYYYQARSAQSNTGPYSPYSPYSPVSPSPPISPSPPTSPSNQAPKAKVDVDQLVALKTKVDSKTGKITHSVTVPVDGSKSHDPDDGTTPGQGITEYSWTFPGGKPKNANKPTASTKYTTPGTKRITLSVRDNDDPARTASRTIKITVIKLTLEGPSSVTRGEDATYKAKVLPDDVNSTFNWRFKYSYGEVSEYTGNINSWVGKMVESGTLEVEAKINDTTFVERMEVVVAERKWETAIDCQVDRTTWGTERPAEPHHLGHTTTRWPQPEKNDPKEKLLDYSVRDVESGPNKGFWYVSDANVWSIVEITINRHFAMTEENLPQGWIDFRDAQGTRGTNEVLYKDILPSVNKHEGTDCDTTRVSHYQFWHVKALKKGTPRDPARRLERLTVRSDRDLTRKQLQARFWNFVTNEIGRYIKEANRIWNEEQDEKKIPTYLPAGKQIDWIYPD